MILINFGVAQVSQREMVEPRCRTSYLEYCSDKSHVLIALASRRFLGGYFLQRKNISQKNSGGILCWMRTLICKTKLFPPKKLRLGFSPPLHLFCFRFFFGIRHTAVFRVPLLRSRTLLLAFGFLLFRFLHYFPSFSISI